MKKLLLALFLCVSSLSFADNYYEDWRFSKPIAIMDKIDSCKSKTKIKILSVVLELELGILEKGFQVELKDYEENLLKHRDNIYVNGIEICEKGIEDSSESLNLISAWKRQYCDKDDR